MHNGIPDHLVEVTKEIEAEVARRLGDQADGRLQERLRLFGLYVAAGAELIADEVGPVAASAVLTAYSDTMLAREAAAIGRRGREAAQRLLDGAA
jgi:hypothetical protein